MARETQAADRRAAVGRPGDARARSAPSPSRRRRRSPRRSPRRGSRRRWGETVVRGAPSAARPRSPQEALDAADEIAATVTAETGKPLVESFTSELFVGLDNLIWARRTRRACCARSGFARRSRTCGTSGATCATSRSASSRVISPWNFPFGIPFTADGDRGRGRQRGGAEAVRADAADRRAGSSGCSARRVLPRGSCGSSRAAARRARRSSRAPGIAQGLLHRLGRGRPRRSPRRRASSSAR